MATLAANISAATRLIQVTGGESVTLPFSFRLDDELLDLAGFDPHPLVAGFRQSGSDRTRWRVNRGAGGSTAASHTAGATLKAAKAAAVSAENLTPPVPFADAGEGAGGVTVDNTVDPPFNATTLIAPGAIESAPDEADLTEIFIAYKRTVVLTDAQIKALPTTSVQIVPQPGVGKLILPIMSYMILDAIAGAYTNIHANGTTNPKFIDGGALHSGAFENHSSNFLGDNDPNRPKVTLMPYAPSEADTSYEYAYSENKEIGVKADNLASGNFTGGNAANTLAVTVIYAVMDV